MTLVPGARLGPYEVLAPLGAGGMGEVYRAKDTKLGREVALKILPAPFINDPERIARFRREAQVLASLNHPHIAQIYGLDESNGTQFLVLELVDGESLDKRIAGGPIPVDEALGIAKQIAEALEAAHEKGIIHRDLKPANVALTKDGHVKVLDFGLAKAVEATSGAAFDAKNSPTITSPAMMTGVGVILGTAAYMSPEQAKGRVADKRSDIWAFGCVLYEMLTGRRAFEGEDVSDTLAFILTKEPDWNALPPGTPAPVRRFLRRSLQKDRSRRLESAADSRLEIDDALTSGTGDASASNVEFHHGPWIAAAAATLVVGALGGGWVVSRVRQPLVDERVIRLQIEPPPGGRFVLGGANRGDLAISPDGKTAAYVASVNGTTGLWVRPLDGTAARLVPGTENAGQPFWSPDSRFIAFVVSGTWLRRVDPRGGAPIDICRPVTALRGASWGSDGDILFSALVSGKYGIFRVSASGGTPSLVIAPDLSRGEVAYAWPLLLPDGHFLYWAESSKPETSGIYAASLGKPAEHVKLLTTESKPVYASGSGRKGYLLWTRGGALVAQEFDPSTLQFAGEPQSIAEALSGTSEGEMHVAASGNGLLLYGAFGEVTELAWFDRAGNRLRDVGQPLGGAVMFRLSPDERHIAVQRTKDLWLVDTERGVVSRFTADAGTSTQPVWSPDGRTILFTHLGSHDLLRKAVNGIGDEQVVFQRTSETLPTDWSGDGRWVLTRERSPDTDTDIWKLPVTPDGKMQEGGTPAPYLRTRFNESFARFSPAPSPWWIAYQSDESGQSEIYIDAFPEPRGKKRISAAGGGIPQWGAGGRELFYVSLENKLMAVNLTLGADTVDPSVPRELFPLPVRSPAGATYAPSRDGQRFLVLTNAERAPQALTVIENWPALLRKGAAAP